jgi:Protein of unknown function (DUF3987)/Bifunctional DNA primase/polymerase, N-terminal/Primase C terminal 1 (PriCT-1)
VTKSVARPHVSGTKKKSVLPSEVLAAAERGWQMFPVTGSGERKKPLIKWSTGATSEIHRLEAFAVQFPGCNWGMATGKTSGVLAIDVDGPKAEVSLGAHAAAGRTLPPTREHRSGREGGGRHLLFQYPTDREIRNSQDVRIGPGIHVRGKGGYIVMPPSIHESGRRYEVVSDAPLAAPPLWLLERAAKPPQAQPVTVAKGNLIPKGERNGWLFKRACSMRHFGKTEEEIREELRRLYRDGCSHEEPEVTDDEIAAIAHSAAKYEPAESAALDDAPWPEPEGFGAPLPPVEEFTPEMLPEALRPWCVDESERLQTPLAFAAVTALAALGMATMRRAKVYPKRQDTSWAEFPNLWAVNIAPPAQKKSPILRSMTEPLRLIEEDWQREHERELEKHFGVREIYDLELAKWKRGFGKDKATAKTRPAPVADEPPHRKRLMTSDATFEALHQQLVNQPAGLGLVRDELIGWLSQLGKIGREGERQFFLQGWDGHSSYTADRVGRGSVHVPRVCLSVIGTTQPGPLRGYFADAMQGGNSHDGFISRFSLAVWSDNRRADWTDRKPNEKARLKAVEVFKGIAKLDDARPLELHFDDGAQELFARWWTEHNALTQNPELSPALAAHLSKYQKTVPALALLFALCDGRTDFIGVSHLTMAIKWARVLATHARRIYSVIEPAARTAARRLAQRIQNGWKLGEGAFTLRDIYRAQWSELSTPDAARGAASELEACGWLRMIQEPATPGRHSERYQINPAVTRNFPDIDAARGGFGGSVSVSVPVSIFKTSQTGRNSKKGITTDRLTKLTKPSPLSGGSAKTAPLAGAKIYKFTREYTERKG